MHPAYSVIVFTCASGAGYGLLMWLSAVHLFGRTLSPTYAIVGLTLALILISVGLLASTLHLGRPERAWRAFSQWRTSWLSREGVAAVITYIPAGLLWLSLVTGAGWSNLLGALAILGALVTVYCTGMIYASLPTIRHWDQPLVAPLYLLFALATGGILYVWLGSLFGGLLFAEVAIALLALGLAFGTKMAYWRQVDTQAPRFSAEAATGLGRFGQVRALEAPHTQPNYVMREMGYTVARKHAAKLRQIVLIAGFAVPAVALALASLTTSGAEGSGLIGLLALVAVVAGGVGILTERWLFFAEAEHVVTLYYGANQA
ncbi:MAG: DmsC/YnfH family molybdoenzyme membrane anchor subunit [Pseudomonadota bacterium]